MLHTKQIQNLKTKNNSAFTLVELIVVIVILAILATISFLSFNSYSSNSRDSVRLGDLNNIKKGLELYQVKTATYPIPEGTIYTGTVNGVDVVYKGIIGDNISNIINVSKTPKDPIDTTKNYIYGITYDKTKYQIAITLENSNSTSYYDNGINKDLSTSLHYNQLSISLDNALALSNNSNINNNSRQARVSGMYNGYIKFNSGSNIYLANIPSLIYNSTGSINLLSTGVYYVVNKNSNLPYTISNTDIYNNKSGDIIIQEYTNKTGATLTGIDITSIVNSTDSTTRTNLINSTFSGTILDSFGGNINTINSVVNASTTSTTSTQVLTNGLSSSTPGTTCYSIKTSYPSSTDGVYWIKPDSNPAFQVYCDMTTDGGGWTLTYKQGGGVVGQTSSQFLVEKNTSNLLDLSITTSTPISHFNFSKFNGIGNNWIIRSYTDCYNNGDYCQIQYFKPRPGYEESIGTAVSRVDNDSNSRLLAATRYSTSTYASIVYDNLPGTDITYNIGFITRRGGYSGVCNTAGITDFSNCHAISAFGAGVSVGGAFTRAHGTPAHSHGHNVIVRLK